MWLGCSVNSGCNVATPEQMMMGDHLHWVGREESVSVEVQTLRYLGHFQSHNAIIPVPV